MAQITAKNAARQPYMPLLRELVRTYQAFTRYDQRLHREAGHGLTVPQVDVIFTLGNTDGMTCSEIGDKTLITKGTLTGVLDRLEARGLVERRDDPEDRRRTRIVLTEAGEALFEGTFPGHIRRVGQRFNVLSDAEREEAIRLLRQLRTALG